MIALVLLWGLCNVAFLLAGVVVVAGMVASLLSIGTWHQRPGFWRAAVAVSVITAITDAIGRHWIHLVFASAAAIWASMQLDDALRRTRSTANTTFRPSPR